MKKITVIARIITDGSPEAGEASSMKAAALECGADIAMLEDGAAISGMRTVTRLSQVTQDGKTVYIDGEYGIETAVAAAAMGAAAVEKRLYLPGGNAADMRESTAAKQSPDALDAEGFRAMVAAIRNIEQALGSPEKKASPSEEGNKAVARKSIVAKRDIKKGELFSEENLTTKRPGNGVSPMKWFEVLGTPAARDFGEDELIEL